MRALKDFAAALMLLLVSLTASAQATKVKGRVTDAQTGESIPYAAVFFKNTTIGVTTDLNGYYSMETRQTPSDPTLTAQILGYDNSEAIIKLHTFSEVNFSLKPTDNRLSSVTIKPDNRRMRRILLGVEQNRRRNDPERRPAYKCDTYSKIELDLSNAEEQITNKAFRRNFGFVFDYMDTSAISGRPYLPVLISETKARKYRTNNPDLNKEYIEANRISGVDNDNLLQQFTSSLYIQSDIYDQFIKAFNVDVPSPLGVNGDLYYNYFLIDSLDIAGRKAYYIRFHPNKHVTSPVFDGEMRIDAEDFALVEFHGKLEKGTNLNWIRDLVIDVENEKVGDSLWFHKADKLYADFSITLKDSSKMVSFLGTRQISYSNPEFSPPTDEELSKLKYFVTVKPDASKHDNSYWNEARPYELSEREQNIYHMVDTIKTLPVYKDAYTIISTLANDYYDLGKFSIGPIGTLYSFNSLEGNRFRLGFRTTNKLWKKGRVTAYAAYSTKTGKVKGGGTLEYVFDNDPTNKLTISAKRDFVQLGKGTASYSDNTILTSLFTKHHGQRLSPMDEYYIQYDHEIPEVFNNTYKLESRTFYSNANVPMLVPELGGQDIGKIRSTQLHLTTRLSWQESVSRGPYIKRYIYTSKPTLAFEVMGAKKGWGSDYSYLRTEFNGKYRMPLPPFGASRIEVNAGKIWGTVPYPLLKLHEGNGTYFLDKSAFSCMQYYEFASDQWIQMFYEHNFYGFFLGHIPLLKEMQLREIFTFKAAWGTLSDKNNGILGSSTAGSAPMFFPAGMDSLKKPYFEMGVGLGNIFRVFRVDWTWRLSHRYHEVAGQISKADNLFTTTVGMEIQF